MDNTKMDFERARSLYERGDLLQSIPEFMRLAEQGYAPAQNILGVCYYNGEGVEKNYELAAKYFLLAAVQGSESAQNNLGACYYTGRGVAQDKDRAARWWLEASINHSAQAHLRLMHCIARAMGYDVENRDGEAEDTHEPNMDVHI